MVSTEFRMTIVLNKGQQLKQIKNAKEKMKNYFIKKPRIFVFFIVTAFISGCSGEKVVFKNQKDYFFMMNPGLEEKYVEFEIFSIEALESCLSQKLVHTQNLLKKISTEFPDYHDVNNFVEDLIDEEYEIFEESLKYFENQKSNLFNIGGDGELYQFKYCDKDIVEEGIIVLVNGKINKRIVTYKGSLAETDKITTNKRKARKERRERMKREFLSDQIQE